MSPLDTHFNSYISLGFDLLELMICFPNWLESSDTQLVVHVCNSRVPLEILPCLILSK